MGKDKNPIHSLQKGENMDTKSLRMKPRITTGLSIQAQSKDVRNDEIIQKSWFKHYRFHLCIGRQREADSLASQSLL
jgi:hypothetical protein